MCLRESDLRDLLCSSLYIQYKLNLISKALYISVNKALSLYICEVNEALSLYICEVNKALYINICEDKKQLRADARGASTPDHLPLPHQAPRHL